MLHGTPDDDSATAGAGIQERLENSPLGRKVVGILITLTLTSVLASAIPVPLLGRDARELFRHYYAVTGLNQSWGVFAPDPRSKVLDTYARLSYDDGGSDIWRPVTGGPWVSPYRDYRWHKLFEKVSQASGPPVRESVTRWVARTQSDPERALREVRLVHRWAPIPPPGGPAEDWVEDVLYTLEVSHP